MAASLRHIIIDVECTKVPRHLPWIEGAKLVSLHLKAQGKPPKAWLFNHPENTLSFARCIKEIQAELDGAEILVNQNLKFDMHWFKWLGLNVEKLKLWCTQEVEYLLQAQKLIMPSLNALCEIHGVELKLDKVKKMWDAGYETAEIPAEILVPYGNRDATSTESVYLAQLERVDELGICALVRVRMAAMRMFQRAEYAGFRINCDLLKKSSDEYGKILEATDAELYEASGHTIENWNSPPQKSAFFFGGKYATKIRIEDYEALSPRQQQTYEIDKKGRLLLHCHRKVRGLGFTPPKGSESSSGEYYSTAAGILAGLRCRTTLQRRVIKLMSERSRKAKIKSTYLDGLPKKVQADGLVHPKYNLSTTITGRPSSSDPNGQNMPRAKTGPVKVAIETRFP